MRYYAIYDAQGVLTGLSRSDCYIAEAAAITQEEYGSLLADIRAKAAYVDRVYRGDMSMDQVPAEWRAEIRERVDKCKAEDALAMQAAATNG